MKTSHLVVTSSYPLLIMLLGVCMIGPHSYPFSRTTLPETHFVVDGTQRVFTGFKFGKTCTIEPENGDTSALIHDNIQTDPTKTLRITSSTAIIGSATDPFVIEVRDNFVGTLRFDPVCFFCKLIISNNIAHLQTTFTSNAVFEHSEITIDGTSASGVLLHQNINFKNSNVNISNLYVSPGTIEIRSDFTSSTLVVQGNTVRRSSASGLPFWFSSAAVFSGAGSSFSLLDNDLIGSNVGGNGLTIDGSTRFADPNIPVYVDGNTVRCAEGSDYPDCQAVRIQVPTLHYGSRNRVSHGGIRIRLAGSDSSSTGSTVFIHDNSNVSFIDVELFDLVDSTTVVREFTEVDISGNTVTGIQGISFQYPSNVKPYPRVINSVVKITRNTVVDGRLRFTKLRREALQLHISHNHLTTSQTAFNPIELELGGDATFENSLLFIEGNTIIKLPSIGGNGLIFTDLPASNTIHMNDNTVYTNPGDKALDFTLDEGGPMFASGNNAPYGRVFLQFKKVPLDDVYSEYKFENCLLPVEGFQFDQINGGNEVSNKVISIKNCTPTDPDAKWQFLLRGRSSSNVWRNTTVVFEDNNIPMLSLLAMTGTWVDSVHVFRNNVLNSMSNIWLDYSAGQSGSLLNTAVLIEGNYVHYTNGNAMMRFGGNPDGQSVMGAGTQIHITRNYFDETRIIIFWEFGSTDNALITLSQNLIERVRGGGGLLAFESGFRLDNRSSMVIERNTAEFKSGSRSGDFIGFQTGGFSLLSGSSISILHNDFSKLCDRDRGVDYNCRNVWFESGVELNGGSGGTSVTIGGNIFTSAETEIHFGNVLNVRVVNNTFSRPWYMTVSASTVSDGEPILRGDVNRWYACNRMKEDGPVYRIIDPHYGFRDLGWCPYRTPTATITPPPTGTQTETSTITTGDTATGTDTNTPPETESRSSSTTITPAGTGSATPTSSAATDSKESPSVSTTITPPETRSSTETISPPPTLTVVSLPTPTLTSTITPDETFTHVETRTKTDVITNSVVGQSKSAAVHSPTLNLRAVETPAKSATRSKAQYTGSQQPHRQVSRTPTKVEEVEVVVNAPLTITTESHANTSLSAPTVPVGTVARQQIAFSLSAIAPVTAPEGLDLKTVCKMLGEEKVLVNVEEARLTEDYTVSSMIQHMMAVPSSVGVAAEERSTLIDVDLPLLLAVPPGFPGGDLHCYVNVTVKGTGVQLELNPTVQRSLNFTLQIPPAVVADNDVRTDVFSETTPVITSSIPLLNQIQPSPSATVVELSGHNLLRLPKKLLVGPFVVNLVPTSDEAATAILPPTEFVRTAAPTSRRRLDDGLHGISCYSLNVENQTFAKIGGILADSEDDLSFASATLLNGGGAVARQAAALCAHNQSDDTNSFSLNDFDWDLVSGMIRPAPQLHVNFARDSDLSSSTQSLGRRQVPSTALQVGSIAPNVYVEAGAPARNITVNMTLVSSVALGPTSSLLEARSSFFSSNATSTNQEMSYNSFRLERQPASVSNLVTLSATSSRHEGIPLFIQTNWGPRMFLIETTVMVMRPPLNLTLLAQPSQQPASTPSPATPVPGGVYVPIRRQAGSSGGDGASTGARQHRLRVAVQSLNGTARNVVVAINTEALITVVVKSNTAGCVQEYPALRCSATEIVSAELNDDDSIPSLPYNIDFFIEVPSYYSQGIALSITASGENTFTAGGVHLNRILRESDLILGGNTTGSAGGGNTTDGENSALQSALGRGVFENGGNDDTSCIDAFLYSWFAFAVVFFCFLGIGVVMSRRERGKELNTWVEIPLWRSLALQHTWLQLFVPCHSQCTSTHPVSAMAHLITMLFLTAVLGTILKDQSSASYLSMLIAVVASLIAQPMRPLMQHYFWQFDVKTLKSSLVERKRNLQQYFEDSEEEDEGEEDSWSDDEEMQIVAAENQLQDVSAAPPSQSGHAEIGIRSADEQDLATPRPGSQQASPKLKKSDQLALSRSDSPNPFDATTPNKSLRRASSLGWSAVDGGFLTERDPPGLPPKAKLGKKKGSRLSIFASSPKQDDGHEDGSQQNNGEEEDGSRQEEASTPSSSQQDKKQLSKPPASRESEQSELVHMNEEVFGDQEMIEIDETEDETSRTSASDDDEGAPVLEDDLVVSQIARGDGDPISSSSSLPTVPPLPPLSPPGSAESQNRKQDHRKDSDREPETITNRKKIVDENSDTAADSPSAEDERNETMDESFILNAGSISLRDRSFSTGPPGSANGGRTLSEKSVSFADIPMTNSVNLSNKPSSSSSGRPTGDRKQRNAPPTASSPLGREDGRDNQSNNNGGTLVTVEEEDMVCAGAVNTARNTTTSAHTTDKKKTRRKNKKKAKKQQQQDHFVWEDEVALADDLRGVAVGCKEYHRMGLVVNGIYLLLLSAVSYFILSTQLNDKTKCDELHYRSAWIGILMDGFVVQPIVVMLVAAYRWISSEREPNYADELERAEQEGQHGYTEKVQVDGRSGGNRIAGGGVSGGQSATRTLERAAYGIWSELHPVDGEIRFRQ